MKSTKKTGGSPKVFLFEPSEGNSRKNRPRVFIYSQMENVTPATLPRAPNIVVAIGKASLKSKLLRALRLAGCRVVMFDDGTEMLEYFGDIMLLGPQEILPDLVIADANLKGRKGVDLLVDLRYLGWNIPFVLATGEGDDRLRAETRRLQEVLGDLVVIEGGYDVEDLLTAAFSLLYRKCVRPEDPPVPAAAGA